MIGIFLQCVASLDCLLEVRDRLLPPFRGDNSPSPLRGGRGPPPPKREGGKGALQEPVEARHAWLAWPWASQAITHERFRVPTVLATRVPWACEWAVGCARGRRALARRRMERASVFGGCVGHLQSLIAGGQDSMHVWGRGGPPHQLPRFDAESWQTAKNRAAANLSLVCARCPGLEAGTRNK